MPRSSQRNLLGRPRKHPVVKEEFDPTTFRKNRSRPALGARGQDAVYQEYDDLFEEDDDGREGEGEEGAVVEDAYADGEASQTEASGDESGFFLLQIDGVTGRVEDRTRDIAPISPKRQRPDNLNLSFMKKKHSFSSTESTTSAPPRPPRTPPRSWRPFGNIVTTTPPQSAAPSVEGSVDPRLPITAPPTPPPKSAPVSADHTNFNHRKMAGLVKHHSDLTSSHPSHPAARANERRFGEQTSSMGGPSAATTAVGRSRSVEGLNVVNIPSPTLFSSATTHHHWTERTGLGQPPPPPPKSPSLMSAAAATSALSALGNAYKAAATEWSFGEGAAVPGSAFHQLRPGTDSRFGHLNAFDAAVTGRRQSATDDQETRSDTSVDEFLDNIPIEYPPGHQRHYRHHKPVHLPNTRKKEKSHSGVTATAFESGSEAEVNHHERRQHHTSKQTPPKRRRSSGAVQIIDSSSSSEQGEDEEAIMAEGRLKTDLAYLRAFRAFVKASASNDAFVSRNPRFDAIQAHRICSHLQDDSLPQVNPAVSVRRSQSNATVRPVVDSKARLREAGEEIMTGLWALMAGRWLNFGKIVISPAHELLMAARTTTTATTATKPQSRRGASASSVKTAIHQAVDATSERRRVLDLGGIPVGTISSAIYVFTFLLIFFI